MLHIIWSILVGFVVGLIAQYFMPIGHLGFWMTSLVELAVNRWRTDRPYILEAQGWSHVPSAGFLLSIIGAIILLFVIVKFGS